MGDHGTFPKWLIPYLNRAMKVAGLDPVDCGRLHAMIISSPNAARRPATYFSVDQKGGNNVKSVMLEGRFANSLAYDTNFSHWVGSFLEQTIANHTFEAKEESLVGA